MINLDCFIAFLRKRRNNNFTHNFVGDKKSDCLYIFVITSCAGGRFIKVVRLFNFIVKLLCAIELIFWILITILLFSTTKTKCLG